MKVRESLKRVVRKDKEIKAQNHNPLQEQGGEGRQKGAQPLQGHSCPLRSKDRLRPRARKNA